MLYTQTIISSIIGGALLVFSATHAVSEVNRVHIEALGSLSDFKKKVRELKAKNLKLVDYEVVNIPHKNDFFKPKYQHIGIWHFVPDGKHRFVTIRGYDNFKKKADELRTKKGLKLVDVESLRTTAPPKIWSGVFHNGRGCKTVLCNSFMDQIKVKKSQEFFDKWKEMASRGIRPLDIDVDRLTTTSIYTLTSEFSTDKKHALYQYTSWNAFLDKWKEMKARKYNLIDVGLSHIDAGTKLSYTGLWRKNKGGTSVVQTSTFRQLLNVNLDKNKHGSVMIDVEAVRVGDKMKYIGVWRTK